MVNNSKEIKFINLAYCLSIYLSLYSLIISTLLYIIVIYTHSITYRYNIVIILVNYFNKHLFLIPCYKNINTKEVA